MLITHTGSELRMALEAKRHPHHRIALIPTMGNLHEGHMQLVKAAKNKASHTVVSIFVNPTQFGQNEDFNTYPRTLEADFKKLSEIGVDSVFAPSVHEMYPNLLGEALFVKVPRLAEHHCGASRPGHFDGVATIVSKLFNIVQPDLAFFGEKDFQQLLVIKRLVEDLHFPIEVIGVPTVREKDGLAMSSRNQYLTAQQRTLAPTLYATLKAAKNFISQGQKNYPDIEQEACNQLAEAGFEPDYVHICNSHSLLPATADDNAIVILAAARLGQCRLIDNLSISV